MTNEYIEDEYTDVDTEYENFASNALDISSPDLQDEDFVILDGSLSEVALRSFFSDGKENKYGGEDG